MIYLLDVNVLIALVDPAHAAHDIVHAWFQKTAAKGWATCPITENGAVRIVSQPKYPGAMATPGAALRAVRGLSDHPGHSFWADSISLLGGNVIDPDRLTTPAQITDTYLLALAKERGGKFATLDRRLVTDAVPDGRAHLHLIAAPLQ